MPDGTIQPRMSLVQVEYCPSNHATFCDDILVWTEEFFLELEGAKMRLQLRLGLTNSAHTG